MYKQILTNVFHEFSSKFKSPDVASSVSRAAPEFCNVYIISKGKISSLRSATSSPGPNSRMHMQASPSNNNLPSFNHLDARFMPPSTRGLTFPPFMCTIIMLPPSYTIYEFKIFISNLNYMSVILFIIYHF